MLTPVNPFKNTISDQISQTINARENIENFNE